MSVQKVAEIAGIPYSTTWRVINDVPGVSPEAAAAVRRAVQQVGYRRPSRRNGMGLAHSLRQRRRNIALFHLRDSTALSNSIVRTVQKILNEQGINLMFGHVGHEKDLPPALQSGEIDGILGYGQFPAVPTPRMMQIPAVWMMTRVDADPDPWGDRVLPDHQAIGRIAAGYLIDRGHKLLAYLNPRPHVPFLQDRGAVFTRCAAARDVSAITVRFAALPPDSEQAIPALVEAWAALRPRPSGLFVTSDTAAVGIYRQLQKFGVRPGRDVELISCDYQRETLSLLDPMPASIDLQRDHIAHLAVERLLWRVRHGMNSPAVAVLVAPTLAGASEVPVNGNPLETNVSSSSFVVG
jgi:DNA-binding LacI/PurR family transcriptional regulator